MAKEKLYLVVKSKSYYGNVLAYNEKTSEYVYLHFGKEIWREKADRGLFDYMNNVRAMDICSDVHECEKFDIYNKYSKSCQGLAHKEG